MQVEVEKKFLLNNDELKRLTEGGKLIFEKTFIDVYFDDITHSLSKKDIWLRERAGKFELKLPIRNDLKYYVNQYQEIEQEPEIYESLSLSKRGDLIDDLKDQGFTPFAAIETHRQTYDKDGFHVDVDQMDFGYNIVEIEKIVKNKSEVSKALKDIVDYAKNYGFTVDTSIRGKLIEYIYRKDKEHYQALVDCGVVIEN